VKAPPTARADAFALTSQDPDITIGTIRETRFVTSSGSAHPQRMKKQSPFRYFKTSPEVIPLAVMM
jgi:hypothetical protein